ncbi:beta-mannosidase [Mucilaginibacter terrae]|uniref:glycoside hydrolase 5 family protein n=1 Tax=Mucilaginibacter terrae TaxID=1955052 RepID=UPI003632411C
MLKYIRNSFFIVTLLFISCTVFAQRSFVSVKGHQFYKDSKPYSYLGANYWYGGLLSAVKGEAGKIRLQQELDFLKKNGITNLRVLVAAEGKPGNYFYSVAETAQPEQGKFNDQILKGLDYFLQQLGKRQMTAILFLTNNWQWSGGFDQYLQWNGYGPGPLPNTAGYTWDKNKAYTSKFYTCDPCKTALNDYITYIIKRTNSYTGKKYIEDTAIMAWELANEPRPMMSNSNDAYLNWISNTAGLIKSLDKNHLVTTGSEGDIASDFDKDIFTKAHSNKSIDYLTIHIWPKNWSWYKDTSINAGFNDVLKNTKDYIDRHVAIAQQLNKPLVIEEFGLPRDTHSFSPEVGTTWRNKYYNYIFSLWKNSTVNAGVINGVNFWAAGGIAKANSAQKYWWKPGDDYMGDPPQEEQGLYSVFNSDAATWDVIRKYTGK